MAPLTQLSAQPNLSTPPDPGCHGSTLGMGSGDGCEQRPPGSFNERAKLAPDSEATAAEVSFTTEANPDYLARSGSQPLRL